MSPAAKRLSSFVAFACCASFALLAPGGVFAAAPKPTTQPADDTPWLPLAQGTLAKVDVAQVLYDAPGDNHFWLHFRITNATDKPIGADLRDRFGVMYPNQWGWSPTPHRQEINERRRAFAPLTDAQQAELLEDYRQGKLTALAPHAAVEYFIAFNNTSVGLSRQTGEDKYLIISLAGRLLLADGAKVDPISLAAAPGAESELSLPAPVIWKALPAGAFIVGESPEPAAVPAAKADLELRLAMVKQGDAVAFHLDLVNRSSQPLVLDDELLNPVLLVNLLDDRGQRVPTAPPSVPLPPERKTFTTLKPEESKTVAIDLDIFEASAARLHGKKCVLSCAYDTTADPRKTIWRGKAVSKSVEFVFP